MQAAVLTNNGLSVESIPVPTPAAGQILMQVKSCGICGSDINLYKDGQRIIEFSLKCGHPHPMDLHRGVIMGHEFSGEIVERGTKVRRSLSTGQLVVARPQLLTPTKMDYIGFSSDIGGGFAEYMLIDESEALPVPNGLSSEIASLTEPLSVARHAVNAAELSPSDCPMVVGCGPIGLSIIACLKEMGISPIIALEPQAFRRQLALRLGADEALYSFDDNAIERWVEDRTNQGSAKPPWVLFNCVGNSQLLNSIIEKVPRRTRVFQLGMQLDSVSISTMTACPKEILIQFLSGYSKDEFAYSLHQLSEGKIVLNEMITEKVNFTGLTKFFNSEGEEQKVSGKTIFSP